MEPAVSHPNVAVQVDSQAVRHEELATAPAGEHLSSVLHRILTYCNMTCSVTHGVVWCGVVWCGVGVVWCGVVWCGVVWCAVLLS